jgi:hypothetical protein
MYDNLARLSPAYSRNKAPAQLMGIASPCLDLAVPRKAKGKNFREWHIIGCRGVAPVKSRPYQDRSDPSDAAATSWFIAAMAGLGAGFTAYLFGWPSTLGINDREFNPLYLITAVLACLWSPMNGSPTGTQPTAPP